MLDLNDPSKVKTACIHTCTHTHIQVKYTSTQTGKRIHAHTHIAQPVAGILMDKPIQSQHTGTLS